VNGRPIGEHEEHSDGRHGAKKDRQADPPCVRPRPANPSPSPGRVREGFLICHQPVSWEVNEKRPNRSATRSRRENGYFTRQWRSTVLGRLLWRLRRANEASAAWPSSSSSPGGCLPFVGRRAPLADDGMLRVVLDQPGATRRRARSGLSTQLACEFCATLYLQRTSGRHARRLATTTAGGRKLSRDLEVRFRFAGHSLWKTRRIG
jgi:hypothetical protein